MSKYIRGKKKPVNTPQLPKYPPSVLERGPILATVRNPLSPAAVGLASMMMMTGATAQDAAPAPRQDSGAVTQQQTAPQQPSAVPSQQDTTVLPQIEVRAPRRVARAAPAAPQAPAPVEVAAHGDVGYQG